MITFTGDDCKLKDIFEREGQNLNRTTKKIFKTTSDCVFCVLRILNQNGFNVAFLLRQCFKILKSRFLYFLPKNILFLSFISTLQKHQMSPAVRKLLEGNKKELNHQLSIEEQTEYLPYDKRWEFPRYRLKLGK